MKAKYPGTCIKCYERIDPGAEIYLPKSGSGVAHNYCIPREERFQPVMGKRFIHEYAPICGARTKSGRACKMPVINGGSCAKHQKYAM